MQPPRTSSELTLFLFFQALRLALHPKILFFIFVGILVCGVDPYMEYCVSLFAASCIRINSFLICCICLTTKFPLFFCFVGFDVSFAVAL